MTFLVVIETEKRPGSPLDAAIHQGYAEEYLLAYLRTKMPAGSPVAIEKVITINPGP